MIRSPTVCATDAYSGAPLTQIHATGPTAGGGLGSENSEWLATSLPTMSDVKKTSTLVG